MTLKLQKLPKNPLKANQNSIKNLLPTIRAAAVDIKPLQNAIVTENMLAVAAQPYHPHTYLYIIRTKVFNTKPVVK